MLQIRLSKPANDSGATKPLPADSVTVACPDHLILADLPVAKCLGSPTANALVKIIGRRSRRQIGERVHFCIRCDFPIAIYGRLSPCEHVFCLDCARSDSLCYLCDERIQKIQTIKMMEGLIVCAAPHCFKSFLKKSDFASHIHAIHTELLPSNTEKDGNDSEAVSSRKPVASDSTVQAPPRPTFSLGLNSQVHDQETHHLQSRDQPPPRPVMQPKGAPPFAGSIQNHSLEQQLDHNAPPGFDRPQNRFAQRTFDPQSGMRQEPSEVLDKQPGHVPESTLTEYPMHPNQPPNFAVPINPNPVLAPHQFGYPPFVPDGAQPFYGASYEMARPESTPEAGQDQGSLLGFPPGPAGGLNYGESYPRPWSMGPAIGSFDPSAGQGTVEGFMSASDPQGQAAIFPGDYARNAGILPSNLSLASPANKALESAHGGSSMDPRDGKGILAAQPMPLPPPPPFPPHLSQVKRGKFYSNETNSDGQSFGWQNERRDSFGSSRD